jgi:hypothetical protein
LSISGWVRRLVGEGSIVTCCYDNKDVSLYRVIYSSLEQRRWDRSPNGHVDDMCAVVDGPDDAVGKLVIVALTCCVEHPNRQYGHTCGYAADAYAVVDGRGDDTCNMGAVTVRVASTIAGGIH